jgi:hypothetical protein
VQVVFRKSRKVLNDGGLVLVGARGFELQTGGLDDRPSFPTFAILLTNSRFLLVWQVTSICLICLPVFT